MSTVLVVDDEAIVREVVVRYLERDGHRTLEAASGDEAAQLLERDPPSLVVLDVMLPGIDGFELCRRIRASSDLPIILLTARGEEADRIVGLELGADDYLTKPFSPRELAARIKAILRRSEPQSTNHVVALGDVTLNRETHDVVIGGRSVDLTAKEFDLLAYFLSNPGAVLSRDVLLDRVWGVEYPGGTRTVDVHVAQLRRKLGRPELIRTLRGSGYKAVST